MVAAVISATALLGPIAMMYMSYDWSAQLQIVAPMWYIYYYSWNDYMYDPIPPIMARFDPLMFLGTLPIVFLRYIFIIMMYRYYSGKTTRIRTLFAGVIAELQLPAFYYILMTISFILYPGGMFYIPLVIPTPLLLLVGYALIRYRPPIEDEVWIDRESTKQWWDLRKSTTEPTIEQPEKHEEVTSVAEDDWLLDDGKK